MTNIKEYDSFKTQDGREIYLFQAINDMGEWNSKYKRYPIFCPECNTAYLKFTTKTSKHCAFLSSMPTPPNPGHSEDCSHRYKSVGKRGAKEFYSTCTQKQALDKMNACINLLKNRNFILTEGDEEHPPHRPQLTIVHTVSGRKELRRLRTRSFYSIYKLDEEDIDFPIVFYGKVYLAVKEAKAKNGGRKFNLIKVRSIYGEKRELQSIYFGDNTIDYIDEKCQYLFAMVGVPKRKGKYINIWFYDRNYSLYRIVESD